MEAMDHPVSSSRSPSIIDNKNLKISRIPKPFSIESLISSPDKDELSSTKKSTDSPENLQINQPQQPPSGYVPFNLPNFPIYNPWVGYLTQTATERLSQFFSQNDEKFSHFLDIESQTNRDKLIEAHYILNNPDAVQREKLAQYFVNNFRDPSNEKLSELLISDYSGLFSNSDNNERIINTTNEQFYNINQRTGYSGLTNCNSDSDNLLECEKDIDLESSDLSSDLSLTLSPSGKNRGTSSYIINILTNPLFIYYFFNFNIFIF